MAQEVLTGNESVEELQRLLDVFNNRIRLIDEKKSTTKPEIYQKVRGEYEAKLLEIQVMLEEKGADLQNSLDQAIAERDVLQPRLQPIVAALDELELRVVIGEVTEEEKAFQEQAYLTQKSEIESGITALDEKINKLSALVGKGQPAPQPAPVPVPQPAPIPQPVIPEDLPPVTQPVARPAPPKPVPPPAPQHPVTAAPQQPVVPVHQAPAPKPVPVPQPPIHQAAAVPKPVPVPPRTAPIVPEPPVMPPVAMHDAEPVKMPTSELEELEKQFASILGSSFGEPQTAPSPAMEEVLPKSDAFMEPEPEPTAPPAEAPEEETHEGELKCPKCGAYNRADNWYCEKCGNELLSAQDLFGGGK